LIYVALLRGINVSGQKKIKMEELKELYESLDLKNVRTYIQSGNVIFESSDMNIPNLKKRIKQKIKASFGFEVSVFIRTEKGLQKIIENTPFAGKDPGKLHVAFLSGIPVNPPIDEIKKVKDTAEEFLISDEEIYLFCPNGYGRTKLSNDFFERKLKLSSTTRNWKTVNKLLELM
jgi:uncharacterized protein (DUF1697 family)